MRSPHPAGAILAGAPSYHQSPATEARTGSGRLVLSHPLLDWNPELGQKVQAWPLLLSPLPHLVPHQALPQVGPLVRQLLLPRPPVLPHLVLQSPHLLQSSPMLANRQSSLWTTERGQCKEGCHITVFFILVRCIDFDIHSYWIQYDIYYQALITFSPLTCRLWSDIRIKTV